MKIMKSKLIFIMLFMTNVDCATWRIFLLAGLALSTVLRLCFFRQVFFNSDTAVGLRGRVSKVPCITLAFSSTFIMSISVNSCGSLQYHCMFWNY